MEFHSLLLDKKIMGVNFAAEVTVDEYASFASNIISKNDYQRGRVRSSGKTYDLLRRDLIDGCVIPPIILAVTDRYGHELNSLVQNALAYGASTETREKLAEFIKKAASEGELLILDGLQRTHTILGILTRPDPEFTPDQISEFRQHKIRLEIYLGLSKPGILYRMLTLNTGQTPMSFRHQLEILYDDYIDNDNLPDRIQLYREVDERRARGSGKYKYADVVDMFYAFSTGSPMPYDRTALVSELRELSFLEGYSYKADADDMKTILVTYNRLVTSIEQKSHSWAFSNERLPEIARPFGSSIPSIFARPQPMAGFGAECKRLLERKSVMNLDQINERINSCSFRADPDKSIDRLLQILDEIAKTSKKIGDAQRAYFQLSFRALLVPEDDSFEDLSQCWLSAHENYKMLHE